jgi:hypothetical protein
MFYNCICLQVLEIGYDQAPDKKLSDLFSSGFRGLVAAPCQKNFDMTLYSKGLYSGGCVPLLKRQHKLICRALLNISIRNYNSVHALEEEENVSYTRVKADFK